MHEILTQVTENRALITIFYYIYFLYIPVFQLLNMVLVKNQQTLINQFGFPADRIRRPIGKSMIYRDYFHRKHTVDFHISLNQWIEISGYHLDFFDTYFDYNGNNRVGKNLHPKTKIIISPTEYLIPDANFKISSIDGKKRLYLFEMHNGKNTGKLLKQVHQHAKALVNLNTHKKYGLNHSKSYKILLVFEERSIMNAFIKRIIQNKTTFQNIHQYFLCKAYEDLRDAHNFENWVTIFGEKQKFFP